MESVGGDERTIAPLPLKYMQRPGSSIPFADAESFSNLSDFSDDERPLNDQQQRYYNSSSNNSRTSSLVRSTSALASDKGSSKRNSGSAAFDLAAQPRNEKNADQEIADNDFPGENDDLAVNDDQLPTNGDVVFIEETDQEIQDVFVKVSTPRKTETRRYLCFTTKPPKRQSKEIAKLKAAARKQFCLQTFFTFIYILLAILAVVFTYSLIFDLVKSMNNPVRSIKYSQVSEYEAPGVAVYPGGAELRACGHYFNNIVTSKVKLSMLDLVNRNCTFINMTYADPILGPSMQRTALMFRGPTKPNDGKEALFLHFELEDPDRDFFTVSYYLFADWDEFNTSSPEERLKQTLRFHNFKPTYALSAGLRMWIKIIMKKTHMMGNQKIDDFKIEYSIVKHHDKRPEAERHLKHLFFIFFEWKDDIMEESFLLTTTTPWSIGAALCGVFLTLHKGYQLAKDSYRRMQKTKQKQESFRQTLKMHQNKQSAGSSGRSSRRTTPSKAVDATPSRRLSC